MHSEPNDRPRETPINPSADPPAKLLYRFDEPGRFALLESETTVPGSVTLKVKRGTGGSYLRIRYRKDIERSPRENDESEHDNDLPASIVIALPLVAIDGQPRQFLLEVLGDASRCRVAMDASDARACRLRYSFGAVDFCGWRTCRADIQRPIECCGPQGLDEAASVEPPIQLFRLRLTPPADCDVVDLGLASLSVTGDVRLAPTGLAGEAGAPRHSCRSSRR